MNRTAILLLLPLACGLALWGCTDERQDIVWPPPGDDTTPEKGLTCLGCHESEQMLKAALGKAAGAKVEVPDKGDG